MSPGTENIHWSNKETGRFKKNARKPHRSVIILTSEVIFIAQTATVLLTADGPSTSASGHCGLGPSWGAMIVISRSVCGVGQWPVTML